MKKDAYKQTIARSRFNEVLVKIASLGRIVAGSLYFPLNQNITLQI